MGPRSHSWAHCTRPDSNTPSSDPRDGPPSSPPTSPHLGPYQHHHGAWREDTTFLRGKQRADKKQGKNCKRRTRRSRVDGEGSGWKAESGVCRGEQR